MNITWKYYLIGAVFVICSIAMLAGKLFFKWPIDAVAVALFLIVWTPAILPLIRRLRFKDLELDFYEKTVSRVQADLANLTNECEATKDQAKGIVKTAPIDIRIRHTSNKVSAKYYRVRVWLNAPEDFLELVELVKYERHPTFRNQFKEVKKAPFEDSFKCWGEFTIKAQIKLKSGEILRRQRYLSLTSEEDELD